MEYLECERDWRERLRDEFPAYLAFYLLGLFWLTTVSSIGVWASGPGFALLALTIAAGVPITALVSLMMVWRMFMIGIDSGRVFPMVIAVGSAAALQMSAFGAAFPALALGQATGELQQTAVAWLAALARPGG